LDIFKNSEANILMPQLNELNSFVQGNVTIFANVSTESDFIGGGGGEGGGG